MHDDTPDDSLRPIGLVRWHLLRAIRASMDAELSWQSFVNEALALWKEYNRKAPRPRPRKTPIPAKLRWRVFRRDGFHCVRCGADEDLEADHVEPESAGGPTTFENLQTLCRRCNVRKGRKREAASDRDAA